jgi:hypothetical protein
MSLTVDAKSLGARHKILLQLARNQNKIVSQAITLGVVAARTSVRNNIHSRIEGGPTRWTERGLLAVYAQPADLRAAVGYNYDKYGSINPTSKSELFRKLQSGVPASTEAGGIVAGRYMEINASNRTRNAKSTEVSLRRAGILAPNQFIVPNPKTSGIDAHGNLPGFAYRKILKGLTATPKQGKGRRSRGEQYFVFRRNLAGNRQEERYIKTFAAQSGLSQAAAGLIAQRRLGPPLFIAKRTGAKNRSFQPVLYIVKTPRYNQRFPVQRVALTKFDMVYNKELIARLESALKGGSIRAPLLLPNA